MRAGKKGAERPELGRIAEPAGRVRAVESARGTSTLTLRYCRLTRLIGLAKMLITRSLLICCSRCSILPIPPLDRGRILVGLLPDGSSRERRCRHDVDCREHDRVRMSSRGRSRENSEAEHAAAQAAECAIRHGNRRGRSVATCSAGYGPWLGARLRRRAEPSGASESCNRKDYYKNREKNYI